MLMKFLTTYQSAVLIGISVCICALVTGGTYAIARTWRAREGIRKRALMPVSRNAENPLEDRRSLRHQKLAGASKLLGLVAAHFVPVGDTSVSAVRKNLRRAGYFQSSALAWYYLIRVTLALLFPAVFLIADQILVFDVDTSRFMTIMLGSAIAGLMAPSFYVSKRIKALQQQCREGFPDFMDLMVVCSEAGISIDQAIGRVSEELTPTFPYLGVCLHMATLELRAGRPLTDAFNTLAHRMGIEEAHNLGSLLQQSEELGTSMSDALRVYSEEMRDKRMSRAEEKAAALPAKMTVPLTMFVFPVVLVVILLPVYVRVSLM
jgi:tight adherence protein C